jgi:predicted secreted Zn-dependent protease
MSPILEIKTKLQVPVYLPNFKKKKKTKKFVARVQTWAKYLMLLLTHFYNNSFRTAKLNHAILHLLHICYPKNVMHR